MIRRCNTEGFELATIHDCFYASPLHMNKVRQLYIDIIHDIAKSDLLSNVLNQIAGKEVPFHKINDTIPASCLDSEYMLS